MASVVLIVSLWANVCKLWCICNKEAFIFRYDAKAEVSFDTETNEKASMKKVRMVDLCRVGAVMILSRLQRSWNRTGDKWATLPDVGDWLVRYRKNRLYVQVYEFKIGDRKSVGRERV